MQTEKRSEHLFAFDLDGTIVHDLGDGRRSIPEELLQTIHELHEEHHVVIATGRRYRSTLPILEVLPDFPYTICHNGLLIFNENGEVVSRRVLSWEEAQSTADRIRHFGEYPVFIFDGVGDCPDFAFHSQSLLRSDGVKAVHSYAKERALVLNDGEDVPVELRSRLIEMACIASPSKLENIQAYTKDSIPDRLRSVLVRNAGIPKMGVLEFFEKQCSKWFGVSWVKEQLGAQKVIVAGDDENDIEMLSQADVSVVMHHALPHVKQSGKIEVEGSKGLNQYLLNTWLK